ncbi:MAG: hypothetical protein J5933_00575 [Clostridia bacterium]|nr:hypothetical protein [Clostridia bacterium]
MALYYAYKSNGYVGRIAKQDPWGVFWGWENGQWVKMPSLYKITYEITNYEDITEEEAMHLIELKESEHANMEEVK